MFHRRWAPSLLWTAVMAGSMLVLNGACALPNIGPREKLAYRPPVRTFSKANITAFSDGTLERYHTVRLGSREQPYNGTPSLFFELDRQVFSTQHLDIGRLKSGADYVLPMDDAPSALTVVKVGPYFMSFREDQLEQFAATDRGSGASISRSADGPFYRLPLTEKQLTELFGKPDSVETHR